MITVNCAICRTDTGWATDEITAERQTGAAGATTVASRTVRCSHRATQRTAVEGDRVRQRSHQVDVASGVVGILAMQVQHQTFGVWPIGELAQFAAFGCLQWGEPVAFSGLSAASSMNR